MKTDLVQNLLTSTVGIIGIIIGVTITTIVNWQLKNKEARLRMLEKVFDKRFSAHEQILMLSKLMRTTVSTNEMDKDSNMITYPGMLESNAMYVEFKANFYTLVNSNTHWLDIELFRELNFIQDYIGNLNRRLDGFQDPLYPEIAKLLKSDFVAMAGSLERQTLKFFQKDIFKMRVESGEQHHKYERSDTMERLKQTDLFNKWEDIEKLKLKSSE